MTEPMSAPGPCLQPYHHDSGPVGVLLCHGFTGSPASMRPWAEDLAARGHTVSVPLWPGHGTTWQELNTTTWTTWYDAADQALTDLSTRCTQVVVAGLSMGGALAIRLAEEHPSDIAALVLVNAAVSLDDPRLRLLPLLKHIVPSLPGISNAILKEGMDEGAYDRTPLKALHSMVTALDQVRTDLPKVTCPALVFRSSVDPVVPASSTARILADIGSQDVTPVLLRRSSHVATLDYDADEVFETTAAFIDRVTRTA